MQVDVQYRFEFALDQHELVFGGGDEKPRQGARDQGSRARAPWGAADHYIEERLFRPELMPLKPGQLTLFPMERIAASEQRRRGYYTKLTRELVLCLLYHDSMRSAEEIAASTGLSVRHSARIRAQLKAEDLLKGFSLSDAGFKLLVLLGERVGLGQFRTGGLPLFGVTKEDHQYEFVINLERAIRGMRKASADLTVAGVSNATGQKSRILRATKDPEMLLDLVNRESNGKWVKNRPAFIVWKMLGKGQLHASRREQGRVSWLKKRGLSQERIDLIERCVRSEDPDLAWHVGGVVQKVCRRNWNRPGFTINEGDVMDFMEYCRKRQAV